MDTAIKKISQEFANGNFKNTYDNMADDICWTIYGHGSMQGKKQVTAFCKKMDVDMAGTIIFNTSCIEQGNTVAIQGHYNCTKPNNEPGKFEYCEVYLFKDEKLQDIKTYAVEVPF